VTRLLVLLDAMRFVAAGEIAPIQTEKLNELSAKIQELYAVLMSNTYPCPICARYVQPVESRGIVTLDWDHECDDMGYKVSSWPVFSSTCEDAEREPYTRRGSVVYRYPMIKTDSGNYPRNHGEQLNRTIEDDGSASEVDYILGSAQERRRLRELLGIGEPDSNWR
jgi:hypothetical protein